MDKEYLALQSYAVQIFCVKKLELYLTPTYRLLCALLCIVQLFWTATVFTAELRDSLQTYSLVTAASVQRWLACVYLADWFCSLSPRE